MNLTKLALKRPVSVLILVIGLVVFGVGAMFSAPLELTPPMEMPVLMIMTVYPGAGPEEIEDLVTRKIENSVASLSGVKTLQSVSVENMSAVMIEMDYGTNMDLAHMDLQERLDMIRNSLPDDAQTPTVYEFSMDMMPSIVLSANATGDINMVQYMEDNIVPEFEKLSGVASVSISGGQTDYISVRLREDRMRQYQIDMNTVISTIKSADFTMPAGTIDHGDQELTLRGSIRYDTTESLKGIQLKTATNETIYLSDIADIFENTKAATSVSRYNGEENVSLSVTKRQSASTLAVTQAVTKTVERINASGMGVQMSVVYDSSEMIVSAVTSVLQTLALGIVLAMVILFLFFGDFKASLIVGSSMPVSVLLTLIAMNFMGFSLNVVSLGGLVIGVGMIVDNSIVVVESCFQVKERGLSFYKAALEGTGVVASSIIASTLTTIAVFLPISLMQGLVGQLFKQLGFTIVFSLLASLISALTIAPLMFVLVKPRERKDIPVARFMAKIEPIYGRFLKKTFRVKWLVVLTSIVLLIGSFAIVVLFIDMELMPQVDEGSISISLDMKPGLKLEEADRILREMEEMVAAEPDVDRYSSSSGGGGMTTLMGGSGSSISVYLKDDRVKSTNEVVDLWREATKDRVDCDVSVTSSSSMSSMTSMETATIYLQGSDRDLLEETSRQVEELMRSHPGIVRVTSSVTSGDPQAEIKIDPLKATAAGLSPLEIVSSVNAMISGQEAIKIRQNGQEYSVFVEFPDDRFQSVSDLSGMILTSRTGRQVPLLDVAEIEFSNAPQSIMRIDKQYVVEITGQPRTAERLATISDINRQVAQMQFPYGVTIMQSDATEMMMEEFSALFQAIAVAVLLVFMIMAMQFESTRFSLIVMICIPFSLIGSFGLLWISGSTLNMPSLMGFLMLVGTVVNNGILFIDTANQYRSSMDAETAVVLAGRTRLRPILMTTLTTVLAMIPMAVVSGGSAEIMKGMAVVIIGGLTASTILTLLLLPTFYLLFRGKPRKDRTYDQDTPDIEEVTKDHQVLMQD